MTYFLTQKVNLIFDLDLDLVYDPKRSRGHRDCNDLFMTPNVNLTFDLDLDLVYDPKRSRGHKRLQ